jgi:hypothetical protein
LQRAEAGPIFLLSIQPLGRPGSGDLEVLPEFRDGRLAHPGTTEMRCPVSLGISNA